MSSTAASASAPYLTARARGLFDGGRLVGVAILASNAESRFEIEAVLLQRGVALHGAWTVLGDSELRAFAPASWAADGSLVCAAHVVDDAVLQASNSNGRDRSHRYASRRPSGGR